MPICLTAAGSLSAVRIALSGDRALMCWTSDRNDAALRRLRLRLANAACGRRVHGMGLSEDDIGLAHRLDVMKLEHAGNGAGADMVDIAGRRLDHAFAALGQALASRM